MPIEIDTLTVKGSVAVMGSGILAVTLPDTVVLVEGDVVVVADVEPDTDVEGDSVTVKEADAVPWDGDSVMLSVPVMAIEAEADCEAVLLSVTVRASDSVTVIGSDDVGLVLLDTDAEGLSVAVVVWAAVSVAVAGSDSVRVTVDDPEGEVDVDAEIESDCVRLAESDADTEGDSVLDADMLADFETVAEPLRVSVCCAVSVTLAPLRVVVMGIESVAVALVELLTVLLSDLDRVAVEAAVSVTDAPELEAV